MKWPPGLGVLFASWIFLDVETPSAASVSLSASQEEKASPFSFCWFDSSSDPQIHSQIGTPSFASPPTCLQHLCLIAGRNHWLNYSRIKKKLSDKNIETNKRYNGLCLDRIRSLVTGVGLNIKLSGHSCLQSLFGPGIQLEISTSNKSKLTFKDLNLLVLKIDAHGGGKWK